MAFSNRPRLRTFIVPQGAGPTDARIVLDGVSGKISVYRVGGELAGQISPIENDVAPDAIDGNIAFRLDTEYTLMDPLGWIAEDSDDELASFIDMFRFGSGTNGVATLQLSPGSADPDNILGSGGVTAEWATHFEPQQPCLTLDAPDLGALIRLFTEWNGHPSVITMDAGIIDMDADTIDTRSAVIKSQKTFQAGIVNITPTTAASNAALGSYFRGTANITFSTPFAATPSIVATAHSSVPGDVLEVSINNPSASGFSIVLARINQTATNIHWQAMQRTDV